MPTLDIVELHHWLPRVASTDLGSLLCHSVCGVVALERASTLQPLGLTLHLGVVLVDGGGVLVSLRYNLFVICGWTQVAHCRHKVFHGLDGCTRLEVGFKTLH